MILLFYNDAFYIYWHACRGNRVIRGKCKYGPAWPAAVSASIARAGEIEAIGYFLHHGGEQIKKTVSCLTPEKMRKVAKCVHFLPEYNDLTWQIASYWIKKIPAIPHLLFCDTAFFADLPYKAINYALPYQLRKQGLRRYGRYGLSHLWISKQIKPYIDGPQAKIISIYLGDHTNIAALKGATPIETSFGFTPIEGILSLTGSGSIDPTIVFYLHAAGMSFQEINDLLSQKSGFAALLGKKTTLPAVFKSGQGHKQIAAREFYCYNVAKCIGSFIAILGGIDGLAFFSENPEEFRNIIPGICGRFAFLGLEYKGFINKKNNIRDLAGKHSRIKVYCFHHSKWRIMEENIIASLKTRRAQQ